MSYIQYHHTVAPVIGDFRYETLPLKAKAAHLVRQSVMSLYVDMIYGERDLWKMFKQYNSQLKKQYHSYLHSLESYSHTPEYRKDNKEYYHQAHTVVSAILKYLEDRDDFQLQLQLENVYGQPSPSIGKFAMYYDQLDRTISDHIPTIGSSDWLSAFLCHLRNTKGYREETATVVRPVVLAPEDLTGGRCPKWREVKFSSYEYNPSLIAQHQQVFNITGDIPPMLTYLGSMRGAGYNNSVECLVALLSSYMIDPGFIFPVTDLNKWSNPTPTAIIYKGCYMSMFEDIVSSKYFAYLPKVTLNHKPQAQRFFYWLLSILSVDLRVGVPATLKGIIRYFERDVTEAQVDDLFKILYHFPDMTLDERTTMLSSGIGTLIGGSLSLPSMEADEETEETDDADDDSEADSGEDTDDDAETDDPEETEDDTDTSTSETTTLTKTAFSLGKITDLDDSIYRMEIDRRITAILENHDTIKQLSGTDIQKLRHLQMYWLYLVNKSTLKMLLTHFVKGVNT